MKLLQAAQNPNINMACNSSGCQSNCYNNNDDQLHDLNSAKTPTPADANSTTTTHNLCIKCKLNPPISTASAADDGRFCSYCFRSNLYGKFRLAVTSHALISPSDNVLVAFSGGPASRFFSFFLLYI